MPFVTENFQKSVLQRVHLPCVSRVKAGSCEWDVPLCALTMPCWRSFPARLGCLQRISSSSEALPCLHLHSCRAFSRSYLSFVDGASPLKPKKAGMDGSDPRSQKRDPSTSSGQALGHPAYTCHPDPYTCHPDPYACHPDRSVHLSSRPKFVRCCERTQWRDLRFLSFHSHPPCCWRSLCWRRRAPTPRPPTR